MIFRPFRNTFLPLPQRSHQPAQVSVNRGAYSHPRDGQVTGSAFVTFLRAEDAAACIRELDHSVLEGLTLRACLGTTKYCNAFLRYETCGASRGG